MYTLEKLFLEFVQTSLTATIIISAYILLMKIFNRNIKERMKYILLILIVIRLLVPATVNINLSDMINNFSTNNISTDVNNFSNTNKFDKNYKVNKSLEKETDSSESKNNIEIQNENRDLFQSLVYECCLIWISGIIILFSIIFFSSFRFKFKLKKSMLSNSKKLELLLSDIKNKLNIKRNIPIFICENIESPCIVGILNTTIYVPKFIFKFSNSDVKYMLTHELIHYKRKDLYFNLLTISALLIHWFNPLVWILVNKIKNCREYACDAGVLEFLGEEEKVDYGMTLINLSKFFINRKTYSKLSICFETNNKIEERIKMIKRFKNGSYKMSARTALGCLVAAAVVFTNGVSVSALDSSKLTTNTEQVQSQAAKAKDEFLIDEQVKSYSDINKIKKYAGFEFKLPEYIMAENKPMSYQLLKLSDTSNAVDIYFNGENYTKNNFSIIMSKDDPNDTLKKINELKGNIRSEENAKCEFNEQEMTFGNVKGKDVTLTITTPERNVEQIKEPESIEIDKYFVWKDNDVYYAINYNDSIKEENHEGSFNKVAQDELGKIVQSFKNIDDIKNVDYKTDLNRNEELSTEIGIMSIYDRDDLKKAEGFLGFNPKMPLNLNNNVVVDGSGVGLTGDSDVENNKINYELNLFYNHGDKRITFNQSNHDSFNFYKRIKENGYVDRSNDDWATNKKINMDKLDVDGKIVYKYMESFKDPEEDQSEASTHVYYKWEENGVYCSLVFVDTDQYQDEIAKEFVNSKTIE